MLFVNNTGVNVKARFGEHKSHSWKTIRINEEIDLPEDMGIRLGFSKVEKKDPLDEIFVESKKEKTIPKKKSLIPILNKEYEEELTKIKGIGPKTVKDIMRVYKTPKQLMCAIDKGEDLPFRDDIAIKLKKKLKRKYGGKHG